MNVVGAGLGDHVDMDAHVRAVLRRVGAGLHLHFLHGVDGRPRGRGGDQVVHDADAVERDAVGDFARAGADEVLPGRHAVGILETRDGAGRDGCEFQGIATVQGQFGDVADADGFRNAGVVGLDGGGGAFHVDGLGNVADAQCGIVADHLVEIDMDVLNFGGLEAGLPDGDGIVADAHELDIVVTLFVGGGVICIASVVFNRGHGGATDDAAGRIGNGSYQCRCGCYLRLEGHTGKQQTTR